MQRDTQTSEPEAPTGPDERGGYAERDAGETSPPTGGGHASTAGGGGDDVESDATGSDAGGRAHTSSDEGHPAGTGERSDRDVGGPVAGEDAEESTGGATGTRGTPGQEPHE